MTLNSEEERQFQHKCDICELSFKTKSGLALHKTYKHASVSYFCNQCGDQATQNSSLKNIANLNTKVLNIFAANVSIRQDKQTVL